MSVYIVKKVETMPNGSTLETNIGYCHNFTDADLECEGRQAALDSEEPNNTAGFEIELLMEI